MSYICSVCGQKIDGDLIYFKEHTDQHIIELVKHDHPEWVETDGLCPRCAEYYRSEIKGSIFKDSACALRIRKSKSLWNKLSGLFGRK